MADSADLSINDRNFTDFTGAFTLVAVSDVAIEAAFRALHIDVKVQLGTVCTLGGTSCWHSNSGPGSLITRKPER